MQTGAEYGRRIDREGVNQMEVYEVAMNITTEYLAGEHETPPPALFLRGPSSDAVVPLEFVPFEAWTQVMVETVQMTGSDQVVYLQEMRKFPSNAPANATPLGDGSILEGSLPIMQVTYMTAEGIRCWVLDLDMLGQQVTHWGKWREIEPEGDEASQMRVLAGGGCPDPQ